MNNNDTSETGIFLIIAIVIAYMVLKKFLLGVFIMIWKWPIIAFLFPFVYVPEFITNILLFWMNADLKETSITFINILLSDSQYIAEKYGDSNFISTVNSFVSTILAPFIIIPLFYYTYKIYKYKNNSFKDVLTTEDLIRSQAKLWPQIKPMVNAFPNKINDLTEGEWSIGLSPYDFAVRNNIIIKETNKFDEEKIRINEKEAEKTFKAQFGRPWKNVEDLDTYERYIFAILITRTCRDTKQSLKLIKAIATSFTTEKNVSKAEIKKYKKIADDMTEEAIKKYADSEIIVSTIKEHFFVNTLLARLLDFDRSRKDGVLASCDFNWLKIKNRRLWYLLNNVGRRCAWSECAGIWYHYNYEKAVQRKIPSPMIKGAVSSLDLDFREKIPNYIPLQHYNRDYS